jgi:hypothetical protein
MEVADKTGHTLEERSFICKTITFYIYINSDRPGLLNPNFRNDDIA